MAKLTPEEIEQVKTAVSPLTPEQRAEYRAARALAAGQEPLSPPGEAEKEDTVPAEALAARAIELGVHVGDLTEAQIAEVRSSLAASKTKPKTKKKS